MLKNISKRIKIILGLVFGTLIILCGCFVSSAIVGAFLPDPTATITPTITRTSTATLIPSPTDTLEPTFTPTYTETPIPTNTTDPQVLANQTQNAAYFQTQEAKPTATVSIVTPTNTPKPNPTATHKPNPTATQKASTPQNSGTFTVTKLTSPIKRGNKATLTISTTAGASCNLSYWTPSGNASSADGLGTKTANAQGVCTWTWLISGSTKAGSGTLVVTVDGNSQTLVIVITQ